MAGAQGRGGPISAAIGSWDRGDDRPDLAGSRLWVTVGLLCVVGTSLRAFVSWQHPLDYDESFTATAARLPLGRLLRYLRLHDSHPPLDYITRIPWARAAAPAGWVRFPSLLESAAALVVLGFGLLWRRRAGLWALGIAGVGSFPLAYANQARMYSGMMLVGVAVAVAADRWLDSPRAAPVAAMSVALLAGLFLHVSAIPLAVGLMAVPGLGRKPHEWLWRAGVAVPVLMWAAAWGPSFAHQIQGGHSDWIPYTSPRQIVASVNELVNSVPSIAAVTLSTLAIGLILATRRHVRLTRVVTCCGGVPIGLIVLAGLRSHALLPRTLAFAWWLPPLGLGMVLEEAWRRSVAVGVAIVALVALIVAPSSWATITRRQERQTAALQFLVRMAQPGDAVAAYPGRFAVLTRWHVDVTGGGARPVPPAHSLAADDLTNAGPSLGLGHGTQVMWVGTAKPTGRAWLLRPTSYRDPVSDLLRCPTPDTYFGGWVVECRKLAIGSTVGSQ